MRTKVEFKTNKFMRLLLINNITFYVCNEIHKTVLYNLTCRLVITFSNNA